MTAARRALVTGGSAGLGAAICADLAARGYDVVNVDIARPAEEDEGRFFACDLSDRAAVSALIAELAAGDAFDMVVLNAGISATGPFEAIPPDAHLKVMAVNLEAPLRIANGLLGAGRIAPGGMLLFVSSLSHFTGYPGAASYAASKDAIASYAASLAKARNDVHVACAFPGPLATDHAARHAPARADAAKRMPPDHAAQAILDAALDKKRAIVPGTANRLAALAGRLAPGLMARIMRRIIFDRLDRPVF